MTDDELIGDWKPKPLVSQGERDRLLGQLDRLKQIALARQRNEPTFACSCRGFGWVETDSSGRGTWARCPRCNEKRAARETKRPGGQYS